MNHTKLVVAAFALTIPFINCSSQTDKSGPVQLKTQLDSASYVLGLDIGAYLKEVKKDINLSLFSRGVEDKIKGKEPALSEKQIGEIKMALSKKIQEEQMKKGKEQGDINKKEGEKFLSENKTKKGVITTTSGLQYMVLTQGKGPKPKVTDKVKVHYKGTLLDGTEFDSSYKRGEPISFPLNGVIKGWTEGVQLMNVGSKFRFFIPSELAYGERGAGQQIGPNATLTFEVELLGIEK